MKRRILLADDDESVLKMLGRVLESEGYEVMLSRTAGEAMNRVLTRSPELVLLDIGMPDKDGWEAYALIERLQPHIPVIAITGKPNQHRQAQQTGIDVLMEKPLDFEALLDIICKLLEKSDLEKAERQKAERARGPLTPPPARVGFNGGG